MEIIPFSVLFKLFILFLINFVVITTFFTTYNLQLQQKSCSHNLQLTTTTTTYNVGVIPPWTLWTLGALRSGRVAYFWPAFQPGMVNNKLDPRRLDPSFSISRLKFTCRWRLSWNYCILHIIRLRREIWGDWTELKLWPMSFVLFILHFSKIFLCVFFR